MENRLISTGDKLKEGIYTKHSCFEKVINFPLDNYLVTVCHESIVNAPHLFYHLPFVYSQQT